MGSFYFQENRMVKKSIQGFTLIELMVAMTIIGIMLAVILPQMLKSKYQAHYASCTGNERNIAAALENYWIENDHKYPDNIQILYDSGFGKKMICPANPTKTNYGYLANNVEKAYTIWCSTRHLNAAGLIPEGYPEYDNTQGLIQAR